MAKLVGFSSGIAFGIMVLAPGASTATPQQQVLAAFERGGVPSAETLIDCIQDAYHQLAEKPFRNDISYTAITRGLGRPDLTITSKATALHRGTDVRFETLPGTTTASEAFSGEDPELNGEVETRLVFVRRGNEIRAFKEQILPTEILSRAFVLDLSGFDAEVQRLVVGPFATLVEFDLLDATSNLSVQREIYQGAEILTLNTEDAGEIDADGEMEFATFFVQPQTCLLLRMEQHIENTEKQHFIEFAGDFTYTQGVRIPPGTFRLQFPAGVVVEDLTNDPEILAEIDQQMEFDEEVLGAQ